MAGDIKQKIVDYLNHHAQQRAELQVGDRIDTNLTSDDLGLAMELIGELIEKTNELEDRLKLLEKVKQYRLRLE